MNTRFPGSLANGLAAHCSIFTKPVLMLTLLLGGVCAAVVDSACGVLRCMGRAAAALTGYTAEEVGMQSLNPR